MKAINLLFICCFTSAIAYTQEFNVGVHINPAGTIPFTSKYYSNSDIKTGFMKFSYDAGLNLNFKFKRFNLELAPSYGQKIVQFHERLLDHSYNGEADYFLKYKSKFYEVPLLVGLRVNKMTKHNSIYVQIGASYEHTQITNVTTNTHSTGVSTISAYPLSTTTLDKAQSLINIIAGIKANTTIKRLGLIDYGVYYHYPLTAVGSYDFQTAVVSSTGNSANYVASYFVKQSLVELKLCYYFWNIDKHFKRMRYGHSPNVSTDIPK